MMTNARQWDLLQGDARERLIGLSSESVQCVVTSPPYWGLRDYSRCDCNSEYQRRGEEHPLPEKQGGSTILQREPDPSCPKCHGTGKDDSLNVVWGGEEDCEHEWEVERFPAYGSKGNWQAAFGGATGKNRFGYGNVDVAREKKDIIAERAFCSLCHAWRGQLGLEPTPDLYVQHIVEIFREVRRVLHPDGTLWLNMGDSYATGAGKVGTEPGGGAQGQNWKGLTTSPNRMPIPGLKPKDLVGMPWRVAFALQADGWWLRSDIVWSKPNPMPESVTDRPTRSHEYIFLLTKKARYFYDADAIREEMHPETWGLRKDGSYRGTNLKDYEQAGVQVPQDIKRRIAANPPAGRNKRTVWDIATQPYPEAHFATFPEKLVEPCIKAGTPEKGACSVCGSPWERIVEKGSTTFNIQIRDEKEGRLGDKSGLHGLKARATDDEVSAYGKEVVGERQTTGFRPTCECVPDPCDVCGEAWVIQEVAVRRSNPSKEDFDPDSRQWANTHQKTSNPQSSKSLHRNPGGVYAGKEPGYALTPSCACYNTPATVLDPFCGSGSAGVVAVGLGRRFLGIDIKAEYLAMAERRLRKFPVRLDTFAEAA